MSSSNVQAFHRQITSPTGASHALSCRLTRQTDSGSPFDSHLVSARENVLQVWEVRKLDTSNEEESTKLFHVATRKLHGTVTSLNRVRTLDSKKDGTDRVLVSFADAKMSLMEWSIEANDLLPVSLHTFEKLPQVREGRARCAVDPASRVAVMLLPSNTGGDGSLAVLPFFQDEMDMEPLHFKGTDPAFGNEQDVIAQTPYAPSHILPLSTLTSSATPASAIISASSTLSNAISSTGPPPIRNVLDMVFLPGFNEPTLALLYSPEPSWTARLDNVSNNFLVSLLAISPGTAVNTTSSAVVIATSPALPYNCLSIHPCPPAIGGALVVTSNGIIHLEQSGKMVGVAANGWFERDCPSLRGVTKEASTVRQGLEGSRLSFVSNHQAVLSCKNGTILSATLNVSGRSVEGLRLKIIGHSVAAACIERIRGSFGDSGHLFVGSENAECLLLKWTASADSDDDDLSSSQSQQPTALDMEIDAEDAAIYGTSEPTIANGHANGSPLKKGVHLTISDAIRSYGAIRSMTVGRTGSETGAEIVAATGAGKTAGLTIFHRSIAGRKKRRIESDLLASDGLWSTAGASSFVASDGSNTLVRRPGSESETIEARTVQVAALSTKSRTLHVLTDRIRITDANMKEKASVPLESSADAATVANDWLTINSAGASHLWRVKGTSVKPTALSSSDSVASNVYHDVHCSVPLVKRLKESSSLALMDVDEDGDDLYTTNSNRTQAADKLLQSVIRTEGGRTWYTTVSARGLLTIRIAETGEKVFEAGSISLLPDSLCDGDDMVIPEEIDPEDVHIDQVTLMSIGQRQRLPHLLVLLKDGTLAVYEGRPSISAAHRSERETSLGLVFAKVLTRRLPALSGRRARRDDREGADMPPCSRRFCPFSLSGYSGAFLTGDDAFWLIKSDHGPARLFEHYEKFIYSFTAGPGEVGSYLVQTREGLEEAHFAADIVFDTDLPYTRIPRDRVYTHIAYDQDSGFFVGAATFETRFSNFDDEGKPLFQDPSPELVEPKSYRSVLELIIPGSWQAIDGYEFRQNEFVTSMQCAPLQSKSKASGLRDFVIIGTGTSRGEDLAAKGSIYVFEVLKIFPDPATPALNHILQLRCFEEAKSVIGTIGAISGYLILAMGQKLYMRALEQDRFLIAVGFLDVGIHVTCMETMKNFLLIGDAMQSVMLVAFQEDPYKLVHLGRDYRVASATSVNFLVNDGKVCFVESDLAGNVRFFEYDPLNIASHAGQRLMCRAEYHTGSECGATLVYAKKGANEIEARQNGILYGSTDGSLMTIVPVRDAVFRRLQALQAQLVRHVQHFGGLNPRAFRTVRNDTVSRAIVKGVLDGDLLNKYEALDLVAQTDLAARISSDRDTILLNLRNLASL